MHWCPAHCTHFILKFHFFNNRNLREKHANEWTFYKGNCFEQLPAKSQEHILDTHYSLPMKALCITDAPNHIRSFRHPQSSACIYIAYLQNHACRNAGKNLMIFTSCTTPPHFISTEQLATTTTVGQKQSKAGERQRTQTFSSTTQSTQVTHALQQTP